MIGDEKLIGKPVGSDINNNKLTYTSLLGLEQTQKELDQVINQVSTLIDQLEQLLQANYVYNTKALNWFKEIS